MGHVGLAQSDDEATASIAGIHSPKVYEENGRMGLQKNLRKPITPAVYDTLFMVSKAKFAGKRFNTTRQQSFWGVINASGENIIPFEFRVLTINQGLAIVGKAEHNLINYGVYSLEGTVLIKPKYEYVKVLNRYLITAKKDGHTYLFNETGGKILQVEADSISLLSPGYLAFYINGKAGIISSSNEIIVPGIYRDIKMTGAEIWVKNFPKWNIIKGYDTLTYNYETIKDWGDNFIVAGSGRAVIINQDNKAISKSYNAITAVNAHFALAKNGNKLGVINSHGQEIIPVNYAQIITDEEVIYTRHSGKHGKWLLFDYYGYSKTKLKYDSIRPISEGRIAIERNGRWGYLDRYGVEVISPVYDQVQPFKNGLAVVTFYGEQGIINRSGKWLALPIKIDIRSYDNNTLLGVVDNQYQIRNFAGDLIYFTNNELEMISTGFIERDSIGVIIRSISWNGTFKYDVFKDGSRMTGGSGLLIFKANNKYGFKDQQQRIIIANRYEAVKPFHQRMAAIKINNKWGFINLDEEIIIQPRYDSVGHFEGNSCITKRDGLSGVVNLAGEEIIPNLYQDIISMSNGRFRVLENGRWGVLDERGAVVIHTKYHQLIPVSEQFYIVEKGGKYGTVNMNGVDKIPLLYDFIGYNAMSKTLVTKRSYKDEWTFLKKAHSLNN
jgi:WG containing repeat